MHHNPYYVHCLLDEFNPLIYKTLHRLNVPAYHLSFEDYAQELRLKLLDIAEKFDGHPLGDDRYRFVAYAGKGLYWYLLDLLKAQNNAKEVSLEDVNALAFIESQDAEASTHESRHFLAAFLHEAKQRLTEPELELFYLLADGSFTVKEIAQQLGVSRKTVYKRKEKLKGKLECVKGLLGEG